MIEKLIQRFDVLDINTIKKIPVLFHKIQTWSNHLSDSKLGDVPWSMLPSLEELFSKVKGESQYIISPIWERNYFIHVENVVETINLQILGNPGLFCDNDDEQSSFLEEIKKNIGCKNIYLMSYPRLKRLSVLHFAILGHEIGHLFFKDWMDDHWDSFFEKNNLKSKIDTFIDETLNRDHEKIKQEMVESRSLIKSLKDNITKAMKG